MESPLASSRFIELIRPIRTAAIAQATGKSASFVSRWRRPDGSLPDVGDLPALAKLLNKDLGELTLIVAEERARRKEAGHAA